MPSMAMSDPKTDERRETFRAYCRQRGWVEESTGRWAVTEIAKATGKPTNKASDLLNGRGAFGSKIAREIEAALGLPEYYFEGGGSDNDFAKVPRVDVAISAGHGALVYEEGELGSLMFRHSFLRAIGVSPASAVIVSVKGSSMEPTIKDGSVLLVSKSAKTVADREVYAFRVDGELYVKRLVRSGETVIAQSDNPDRELYPDMRLTPETSDFEIIGRALWMGARL